VNTKTTKRQDVGEVLLNDTQSMYSMLKKTRISQTHHKQTITKNESDQKNKSVINDIKLLMCTGGQVTIIFYLTSLIVFFGVNTCIFT
jgi:hypothetical protein